MRAHTGAVVATWSERRWQRLTVTEGSKGPRTYDWAYQRVIESRDGLPGEEVWLIARRSLTDPTDIAYFLSNAPLGVALERLAQVAAARATIEQCLETAKGETGLDQYEVRSWQDLNKGLFMAMLLENIAMFIVMTFIDLEASFSIVSNMIMLVTEKGR